jgi:spore germination protein YaaH
LDRHFPALVALLLVLPSFQDSARATDGVFRTSAFLTNALRGVPTVETFGKNFEKISVFAYHITTSGDVLPASAWVPDTVDHLMQDPGGRTILVTVNNRVIGNDGKLAPVHSGETALDVITDPAKRIEHIRQLAALSLTAHGLELNYENFPPEAREPFTAFVRDLRAVIPPGKKLSIVLQAKTTNAPGSRGRAVDWRAIEPYADYLRVMAYYYAYSTSAHGPVISVAQLEALAKYMLTDPEQSIPAHKASVILSLWGWDWPMPVGTPGRLVQYAEAMAIAEAKGVTPIRDPVEKTLHFEYVADDGKRHVVWIDDFESIQLRIDRLHTYGMPRIEIWNLNTGDPRVWPFARDHAKACGGPLRGTPVAEALDFVDMTFFPPPEGGGPCP